MNWTSNNDEDTTNTITEEYIENTKICIILLRMNSSDNSYENEWGENQHIYNDALLEDILY